MSLELSSFKISFGCKKAANLCRMFTASFETLMLLKMFTKTFTCNFPPFYTEKALKEVDCPIDIAALV